MGKNNKKKDPKDIKDPVKLKVSFLISEHNIYRNLETRLS